MTQKIAHCHTLIRETAKELAGAAYEDLMSNPQLYSAWKDKFPQHYSSEAMQRVFIARKWGLFIDVARATLALQLRYPIDDATKDIIVEALCQDQTLVRGRKNPHQVLAAR